MNPFLGSLMCVSFNFAPKGWVICAGQLLSISQNQALFSLLGTTYGGDGINTFGLPDLRGRAGLGAGQGPGLDNFQLGQKAGEETHTLLTKEMPAHNHLWMATSTPGSLNIGAGNVMGGFGMYVNGAATVTMNPGELPAVGGSQAHENRSPALAMTWIIALVGIFPSRN